MSAPPPRPGLRLLAACRPEPRTLAALAGWSLVEAAPGALSGLSVAHAVDAVRSARPGTAALWLGALVLAIACGALATRGLYAALAAAVEQTRDLLMGAVVHGSVATLATTGRSGPAPLTHLVDQVDQVRNLLSALARSIRTTAAPLLAALVGLFALSPVLGLTVAVPLVVAALLYAALLGPLVGSERAAARADEQLGASATSVLASSAAVHGLGAQHWAVDHVVAAAAATGRADLRVARLQAWRHVVIAVGGYAPLGAVLVVSGPLLDNGQVSLGDVVGATTYVLTALLPALSASVTGAGGWLVQLAVLLGRLATVADVPDPAPVATPAGADPAFAVSAHAATFEYRAGARPVIEDLDLSVAAGQLVALVGPSGAGKSTFAHLAVGLLRPTRGELGVGPGRRVVLLPQTPYILSGSARENLCYLAPGDVTDDQLWLAVDAVGLRESVARRGGLDALVGAPLGGPAGGVGGVGGVGGAAEPRLTPGEAQRLVLARGWLSGADVLVLDEAWSLLDAPDRRRIESWMRAGGRTLVVVSHHLDLTERADLVGYFDGRTVRTGRHHDLIARCGAYRELVRYAALADAPAGAPADG